MQLGMIGLGRMGGNMTKRLAERGHDMKTYDPQVESTAKTLEELRDQLDAPRSFWMMVPAGEDHRGHVPDAARARRAGRRDRRRRQLELPRLAAALRRREGEGDSASSTPASRAASGGSRTATA